MSLVHIDIWRDFDAVGLTDHARSWREREALIHFCTYRSTRKHTHTHTHTHTRTVAHTAHDE